jgi:hypothetical protein
MRVSEIVLNAWEILFVAVGIAQLSSKMVSYTASHTVSIRTFSSSDGSCAAMEGSYCQDFSAYVVPSRDKIYKTIKQFKRGGIVCDKRPEGRRHIASVRV